MVRKAKRKTGAPGKKRGPLPSGGGAGGGRDRKAKPPPATPWYKRGKALIIGAGALAVALLGVINLWDRIFPPPDEDVARIESVQIIKRTPLTAFAPEGLGSLLPLTPVPNGASGGRGFDGDPLDRAGFLQAVPAGGAGAAPTPLFTDLAKPPAAPLPTAQQAPKVGPTSTFTPLPTPTPTPSPTPTFTSTGTGSPSPSISTSTGSPTPSPSPAPTKFKISTPLTEDIKDSIAEQKVLADVPRVVAMNALNIITIEPVDETGASIPPAELAEELAEALAEVEATAGPEGDDPQGWTVAVRVSLEGLANVPLLLTWSLDGLDVPHTWQAENLAYRVVGATPHDAGVAQIWVPDLKRPGTYNVNIKLSYEETGSIADLQPLGLQDPGVVQGG